MKRISIAFTLEALLCGGPITVATLYGLPWLVLGPLMIFGQSSFVAAKLALWLFGCLLVILVFWRLALSTITNQKFAFCFLFWLGVVGVGLVLAEVSSWAEGPLFSVAFIAPALCALHFIYLQSRREGEWRPTSQSTGLTASCACLRPVILNIRWMK